MFVCILIGVLMCVVYFDWCFDVCGLFVAIDFRWFLLFRIVEWVREMLLSKCRIVEWVREVDLCVCVCVE